LGEDIYETACFVVRALSGLQGRQALALQIADVANVLVAAFCHMHFLQLAAFIDDMNYLVTAIVRAVA
jgi:hypothetical protein